jgi:glycosyltransferase involved in cell wall biosynthesis
MLPAVISVIVPTYNGAAYLAETLASVRAQDYRRPEIAASFRPSVRLM